MFKLFRTFVDNYRKPSKPVFCFSFRVIRYFIFWLWLQLSFIFMGFVKWRTIVLHKDRAQIKNLPKFSYMKDFTFVISFWLSLGFKSEFLMQRTHLIVSDSIPTCLKHTKLC